MEEIGKIQTIIIRPVEGHPGKCYVMVDIPSPKENSCYVLSRYMVAKETKHCGEYAIRLDGINDKEIPMPSNNAAGKKPADIIIGS